MTPHLSSFAFLLAPVALWGAFGATSRGSKSNQNTPPREVRDLAGTYKGSWTMFGIDHEGQVIKRMSWTDVMRGDKPTANDKQAFITTVDEMTFLGRPGPPMRVPGREGYFLNADGSLGEYFVESFGQSYKMQRLADNVWTYATIAAPQELQQLGFPSGATAQHVIVKVITKTNGVETHRISRLTTASWKDAAGKQHDLQFISLSGAHTREVGAN